MSLSLSHFRDGRIDQSGIHWVEGRSSSGRGVISHYRAHQEAGQENWIRLRFCPVRTLSPSAGEFFLLTRRSLCDPMDMK